MSHIFISHATKDDEFVKQLRQLLEGFALTVWVDSRNLRGGDKLVAEIERAIESARQIIVVISPNTVNSPWVRKEINKALAVEKERRDEGHRVIPLLLPGIEPSALALWFGEEPVGVKIQLQPGGLSEALPQILAALSERLPDDAQPAPASEAAPVEELILKLSELRIETHDGKRRAKAKAQLVRTTRFKRAAYRRDGGQSYDWGAQWCATVAQDIQAGEQSATTALAQELAEYLEAKAGPRGKALLPKLQTILGGDRGPALADDPALDYQDAVELQLLLEKLGPAKEKSSVWRWLKSKVR